MAEVVGRTEDSDERRMSPLITAHLHLMRPDHKPKVVPLQEGLRHVRPKDVASLLHTERWPIAGLSSWVRPEDIDDCSLHLGLVFG
eukprot:CAMPEP_0170576646 /NCGR_PEP_ID=MMETSP0224-20130122/4505_1 /TAXON_ID=285029 /ORGANISM="Togula jolla, Strain CCCM 725" /LENGTH=85 /DNA_ID=CAMNT_0010899505 /DNA_START=321 /DNA_END=578 /DNA_ORIENTATION=+